MKRYCVVLQSPEDDEPVVEFYWADDFDHAISQAVDSNPEDYKILTVVRDQTDTREFNA